MKAVVLAVSESDLKERHARSLDRWDEMWEGVLHMPPAPDLGHQGFASRLTRFLGNECERRLGGEVFMQASLHDPANPKKNYRVPDLLYVAKGNERVLQKRGVVGAADAVIEVRSPDGESYDKFPFFARLGVRQVIVVDADTREQEVYRLAGREYVAVAPDKSGWIVSEVLGVRFRWNQRRHSLRVEALDDPAFAIEV